MKTNSLYYLSLLLAFVAATCGADEAQVEEQRLAAEIEEIVCDTERGPPKFPKFYDCLACCQGMHPFAAKKEPNAIARGVLLSNPVFTKQTQDFICGNQVAYAKELKTATLDVAGGLKFNCGPKAGPKMDCTTAAGMTAFFNQKVDCFRNCKDSATPGDLKFCIPFAPDGNAKPAEFEKLEENPPVGTPFFGVNSPFFGVI